MPTRTANVKRGESVVFNTTRAHSRSRNYVKFTRIYKLLWALCKNHVPNHAACSGFALPNRNYGTAASEADDAGDASVSFTMASAD